MDVYREKIQHEVILNKFKWIIVVIGDMQNKDLIGYTWLPTSSVRTLKYFLVDHVKQNARVHQLDFIEEFLQGKVKNRVFVKLDSIYADYFHNVRVNFDEHDIT